MSVSLLGGNIVTHATSTGRRGRAVGLALASLFTAAALIGLSSAASAADDDIPPKVEQPAPEGVLTLTLTPDNGGPTTTVTLLCTPDGGSHPTPKAACDSLRAVGGNFNALPDTTDFCPLIFDPHTARATGIWKDRLISYEETFSNRCFAAVGTDDVFNF
jgi:hypothetical protein